MIDGPRRRGGGRDSNTKSAGMLVWNIGNGQILFWSKVFPVIFCFGTIPYEKIPWKLPLWSFWGRTPFKRATTTVFFKPEKEPRATRHFCIGAPSDHSWPLKLSFDGQQTSVRHTKSSHPSRLVETNGLFVCFCDCLFALQGCTVEQTNRVAEWFRAGLHPSSSTVQATSGIYFSLVPSSNPLSRFVNSQLVCLLPVGIFNYVTFIWNVCFLCFSGMLVN